MSLKKTVMELSEAMQTDILDGMSAAELARSVRTYGKMLEVACKAAGDETPAAPRLPPPPDIVSHRVQIEAAKEEFRKQGVKFDRQEEFEGVQTELVGGPGWSTDAVPTYFARPAGMPVGSRTRVGEAVYMLKSDNKLHYCKEATLAQQEPKKLVVA